ncbi:MAG: hypothetical protein AAF607_17755 [Pseudomonadota bacterium]
MSRDLEAYDRVFIVRLKDGAWVVTDGATSIATLASQRRAIRCAALAAMTAQAKGYVATFRLESSQ